MTVKEYNQDLRDHSWLEDFGRKARMAKLARMKHIFLNEHGTACVYCGERVEDVLFRSSRNEICPKYAGPQSSEAEEKLFSELIGWLKS